MKDYIQLGMEKGLISFNEDKSRITYIFQKKERNYNNPEEKVQAETFLKLVFDYHYPVSRIKLFVPVTRGSDVREADIIVYIDALCLEPHIVVECKRQDISEAEFLQAINQAFSYAYYLPCNVKYVWVTSGIRNEYYEVDKNQDTRNQIPDIPQFGVEAIASYKYVSSKFGYRIHPVYGTQKFHSGVDLAAPAGTAIYAAASGVVAGAGYNSSMGNYVMINHGSGLYTVYMHASALYVSEGDVVSAGQTIAAVGSTGVSTGNHLHFSVRLNGNYVDPNDYIYFYDRS